MSRIAFQWCRALRFMLCLYRIHVLQTSNASAAKESSMPLSGVIMPRGPIMATFFQQLHRDASGYLKGVGWNLDIIDMGFLRIRKGFN